ncbi:AB hydrolase-1 domain-containing protein [Mycena venus]|uniref:AB hydrolase-1 domain-containing protein n=1 Tax=Mycena venus TaxID=2733690 RepID=A0A8H6X4N0_9AGAR|nr:AB hydrolase-1 domain-containing protein [Mycena venus]
MGVRFTSPLKQRDTRKTRAAHGLGHAMKLAEVQARLAARLRKETIQSDAPPLSPDAPSPQSNSGVEPQSNGDAEWIDDKAPPALPPPLPARAAQNELMTERSLSIWAIWRSAVFRDAYEKQGKKVNWAKVVKAWPQVAGNRRCSTKSPTGTVQFNYVISTPTHTSTSAIDPALPTVLFLHPVYIGKIIYHPQFADRELRRFNLVALDLRCHARTIRRAGKGYEREVAARHVALLMIPRYHLFGMSMGGCIALQTAILFPLSVLSIFVVSSLPLTEPPDVGEGRQEI